MTAVMAALHRVLPHEEGVREMPYRTIIENAAHAAGAGEALHSLDETEKQGVSVMAHLSFGATAGAGYPAFAGRTGLHPAAEGALYGLAVWGGSYLGVMPATGLYRAPTEDTASRNLMLVAAHAVWGAALGLAWHALTGKKEGS